MVLKKSAERSKFRKRIYSYVFKSVEVICLSELLIEDIETIYRGKVYILPNGIPQVNFENNYSIKEGLPVQLLYLSNLIKGKGILVLMEAVILLKAAGHSFHLRIVGAEHDITYRMLEDIILENDLKGYVSLIGPKFNEEKAGEFRNADVFVLPSDYDTFGLVLLEAMQFGVPCISTPVGAIPEVLGEGRGIIIPRIKALDLSEALAFMINNPAERKRMSEAAFEHFKANYTTPVFERGLFNIISSQPLHVNNRLVNNI